MRLTECLVLYAPMGLFKLKKCVTVYLYGLGISTSVPAYYSRFQNGGHLDENAE